MMEIRTDANGRKYEYHEESVKNKIELDRLRAEYAALQESVTAKDLLIASLKASQCTSPWEDSPPCRGIQRQLDIVADLTQQLAAANGRVERIREIGAFLLGESAFDGVWFGDKHPNCAGNFWWRTPLRAALSQQVKSDARDAERLQFMFDDECSIESLTLGNDTKYRINWPSLEETQAEWFPSPRAAIDAAISAQCSLTQTEEKD